MSGSKTKNYPPQVGEYSVKVKNGAGWTNYQRARFQISVGQEYHEGEKLKASFNWAAQRFEGITICVNDTLQRFNYLYDGMSEDEAYKKSEAKGREWIERNQHIWRSIPNVKIVRWDEWKKDQGFPQRLDDINKKYETDQSFKSEVDHEIQSFWSRRLKKNRDVAENFSAFQEFSKAYLLEEIAVFPLMFEAENAVDIYPGSTLLPCKLSGNSRLGQRGYTRIDFKKNNTSMPAVA